MLSVSHPQPVHNPPDAIGTGTSLAAELPVDRIRPNPEQPRRHFAGIEELAHSLREQGQVTPILVRPLAGGGYEIVHGERRWRAAKLAGLETIRAEVRTLNEEEAYRLALIENVQQADLNAIEEGESFRRLLAEGMTQQQVGTLVGKTQSYVAQKIRLLEAPAALKVLVAEGALSEGHARQLLKLERLQAPWSSRPFELAGVRALLETDGALPGTENLGAMYNIVRPEDQPPLPLWAFPKERIAACPYLGALQRSYVALLEQIVSAGGEIPQWQVTAWWWAHGCVVFRLAVSVLARALDHWAERHRAAVLHLISRPEAPKDPDGDAEWWAYRSDLRHSGALPVPQTPGDVPEARWDAFMDACVKELENDTYSYPSSFQKWGTQYDVGIRLSDPVGAAMSRDIPQAAAEVR